MVHTCREGRSSSSRELTSEPGSKTVSPGRGDSPLPAEGGSLTTPYLAYWRDLWYRFAAVAACHGTVGAGSLVWRTLWSMRIAVWHSLPSGGGKRALYDHIEGLLDLGHQVECWCPPMADQKFLPLRDLAVEHVVPLSIAPERGLTRALSRMSQGGTATLRWLRAMDDHSQRCASEINRSKCDVLYAAAAERFAVTGLARYIAIPSVLYLQEPFRPLYEAAPTLPWAAPPVDRFTPMQVLRRFRDIIRVEALRVQVREEFEGVQAYDRVLTNSYYSKESLLRTYGIEAPVCYLGVDTTRYVDRGFPRDFLVVGIGAFSPSKRVEVAIEAVAALPAPRPRLIWIGNEVWDSAYMLQLRKLAQRRSVDFSPLVNISHAEVVDVLNRASAMIYAPRLEPFGFAPLEAAACGVPVVAKAEGGVRETVIENETGFLVDSDPDLSEALQRILGDTALGARMRAAARANVITRWSTGSAARRVEAHLAETVADRAMAHQSSPTHSSNSSCDEAVR